MWLKLAVAFISGAVVGGALIGITDWQASKDADEKFIQSVQEAYLKGVGRGIQAQDAQQ